MTRADRIISSDISNRAQGCLLGQLAGDALGSLVEFQGAAQIRQSYPQEVRELDDGGTWHTIAGQPTDDSEMALMLARMLVEHGSYDPKKARDAYLFWLNSGPFDCGATVAGGLLGEPKPQSQANALFAVAIAQAIGTGCGAEELYRQIVRSAEKERVDPTLSDAIHEAKNAPPADYEHQQGWVLTAFQNALWQLTHAPSLEEGVVDTVMRGGDTDTNAAICGALLGAVHGREAIPKQWLGALLSCRPAEGTPGVHQPRPECFWPVDALELAESLVTTGA